MTDTLYILDQYAIKRCSLHGCEQRAIFRLKNHFICEFHHMLLLHGRGLVNYLEQEDEKARDATFGLSVEDEDELSTPGGKPQ